MTAMHHQAAGRSRLYVCYPVAVGSPASNYDGLRVNKRNQKQKQPDKEIQKHTSDAVRRAGTHCTTVATGLPVKL